MRNLFLLAPLQLGAGFDSVSDAGTTPRHAQKPKLGEGRGHAQILVEELVCPSVQRTEVMRVDR